MGPDGAFRGLTRADTAPAPAPSPSPYLPLPSQRPARQGRAAASAPLLRMPTHPPAHAPCATSLHSKGGLILPARFFLLQPDCGLRDVAVPGAAAAPVEAAKSCPPPHLRAPRRTARTHLQPPPAARRPALAHPPAAAPPADWFLPVSFSAVAPLVWLGGLSIRIKPRPPPSRALAAPPSLLLSYQPVVGPFPCHSGLFWHRIGSVSSAAGPSHRPLGLGGGVRSAAGPPEGAPGGGGAALKRSRPRGDGRRALGLPLRLLAPPPRGVAAGGAAGAARGEGAHRALGVRPRCQSRLGTRGNGAGGTGSCLVRVAAGRAVCGEMGPAGSRQGL